MLILVGVTVTVALNGGLFEKARQGAKETEQERQKEELTIAVASAYDVATGIIKKDELEKALGENWNVEGVEGEEGAPYTCTIGGNEFIVCESGKILVIDYQKILQLTKKLASGDYEENEENPYKQLCDELLLDANEEDLNVSYMFMVEETATTKVVYWYFYESGVMLKLSYTTKEDGDMVGVQVDLAKKEQDEYAYKLARKLDKVKAELNNVFLGKTKDEITTKYTEEELENYVLTNSDNINSIDLDYDETEISVRELKFLINDEELDFCNYNNNMVRLITNDEGVYSGTQFYCFD